MADSELESTDIEHPPSETSGNAADSEATPEHRSLSETVQENKISETRDEESIKDTHVFTGIEANTEEVYFLIGFICAICIL